MTRLDKAASFAAAEPDPETQEGTMKWEPIETAPDRGLILMYYPATGTARGRKGFTHSEMITIGGRDDTPNRRPTHWMPLPAPPTPEARS